MRPFGLRAEQSSSHARGVQTPRTLVQREACPLSLTAHLQTSRLNEPFRCHSLPSLLRVLPATAGH
eukprot:7840465-Alexandrium_andersonii.AAC.1